MEIEERIERHSDGDKLPMKDEPPNPKDPEEDMDLSYYLLLSRFYT